MTKKVVLITGASSGIGFHTCLRFAQSDHIVFAAMRDIAFENVLLEKAEELDIRHNIHCLKLDVTREREIENAVSTILDNYGRIDILINNAGYAAGGIAEEIPLSEWEKQMKTNFLAVIQLTQSVLPIMRKQNQGLLINISSLCGKISFPGYAPYCASKFAVEGFSEALRHELRPFGIKVVLVEPGVYRTKIWNKGFSLMHPSPDEKYQTLLSAVTDYARKLSQKAEGPEALADKIVKISRKRSPSLRYSFGQGSILTVVKAFIPWKWFERIVHLALKIQQNKQNNPSHSHEKIEQ